MTTTNTSCQVSKPSKKFVYGIKLAVGLARCKNRLNDDIIYATLKDCNMDKTETCRRLTMIHDVREVASSYSLDEVCTMLRECNMDQTETCRRLKMIQDIIVVASTFSVDYVYTMLKECNMDKTETCRRLKMIQDIKVVASTYSVDDVYATLKECNMDKSEATQRLLYFDTFEEVKKKKGTRKNVSNVQWRGASRGNFHSSKVFNDASGGRNLSSGREYGVSNNVKKVFRPKLPIDSRKESNVGHMAASAAKVNGSPVISNGSHNKLAPKLSSQKLPIDSRKESNVGHMAASAAKVNGSPVISNGSHNKLAPKLSSQKLPIDSRKESNVGHMAASAAKVNGSPVISNGSHNKLAPKLSSDVTSTTKDPKAVSYQNTKYTCYVGTIKC